MNIIITGGNGYLGSNVARRFLSKNHSVYIFSKNTSNIKDILPKINYHKITDKNPHPLQNEIAKFKPDLVFHFGWSGGNNHNDVNNPTQFYDNVESSITLINILKKLHKKPKFIGVGSFAEYGNQQKLISEDTLESPTNLYGLSKLTVKQYSEMLCKMYNIKWIWIRPCFIYGPGDVSTRLIPTLINKFKNNLPVNLDKCDTLIDYLYIDDFVNFVYDLSISSKEGVYNICSGKEYKLRDIIQLIHNLVSSKSIITFSKNIKYPFSQYICGDNSKVKSSTNLKSFTDIKEGLIKTIKNYSTNN